MVRGRNAFPCRRLVFRSYQNAEKWQRQLYCHSVCWNTVDRCKCRFVRFHGITRILSTYSNVAGARSTVVNSYREQLLEIGIGEGTREARLAARCVCACVCSRSNALSFSPLHSCGRLSASTRRKILVIQRYETEARRGKGEHYASGKVRAGRWFEKIRVVDRANKYIYTRCIRFRRPLVT